MSNLPVVEPGSASSRLATALAKPARSGLAPASDFVGLEERARFGADFQGDGRLATLEGAALMAMYVYSTEGEPVGFLYETFIHDLDGAPLGRIIGSRVHRFDGSYVGEWYKESVVERPGASARPLPPMAPPPNRTSPGASWRRRGVVNYGYPDIFHRLRPDSDELDAGAYGEAAE